MAQIVKILLVGNHLSGPGVNRGAWHEIADHLRAAGHTVITTSARVNKAARLTDMLTTIILRRYDYQIAQIDVFSGPAFVFAECCGAALKALRKPFILTLHGGNLPEFARKHPVRVGRLLRAAAAVTTPSRYLQEKMAPYRPGLILIPNPLGVADYPYQARAHPQPSLMWLRAFHAVYHPELAVEVLSRLTADFPNVSLAMVGPDKGDGSFQRTQARAAVLGVSDHIRLTGGVSKISVPGTLAKGDIFLNTTNIDNTPVSVMEAMACGLCVVSTYVGGLPYLLEDGVDALLVPPDDPEAMAAAVRRVLTEPGLAEKLSVNARRKAEGFDWAVILPQWEELFVTVMKNV